MTGTSLVLLAMYTTVNVTGPASSRLSPEGASNVLTLMLVAGALTLISIYLEGKRLPNRMQPPQVRGLRPKSPPLKRSFGAPRDRRL